MTADRFAHQIGEVPPIFDSLKPQAPRARSRLWMTTHAMRGLSIAIAVVASMAATARSYAADPFYIGKWKIDSATVAPWADAAAPRDEKEMSGLIGKSISVRPHEISGPQMFACKQPKYKVVDYTADMLFQGAFGEMQSRDKTVDPLKLAASVGFVGSSFKTLETGCEFDFHFANPNEIKIGLNDRVYTLKKQ